MGGILVILLGLIALIVCFIFAGIILFATMYGIFDEERKRATQARH